MMTVMKTNSYGSTLFDARAVNTEPRKIATEQAIDRNFMLVTRQSTLGMQTNKNGCLKTRIWVDLEINLEHKTRSGKQKANRVAVTYDYQPRNAIYFIPNSIRHSEDTNNNNYS